MQSDTPENLHFDFSPFPELSSERLLLRKLRRNEAPEMLFLRSDERVMRYIDKARTTSIEEAQKWVDMIIDGIDKNELINWGITVKGDEKLLGTLGFWNIRKEHSRAEIGYNLHPDSWNKGIMSEAIGMALKYAFNVMNLHSIDANINPANEASASVLTKNGFVREAYYKENFFYNGNFLDTAVYSILNPAHRK
ncbi:MAG: acetyltransferase, ribosomal protein N-acetylase [Bacteroidetes bacterium]|nr:MAG: acetyltransferase, ribosomal protein N-acetylase [Bacteroidota bacterium]